MVVAASLFFAAHSGPVRAQEAIRWKTGADFAKSLRAPLERTRNDRPLGETLQVVSRDSGVAMLLDRRVDPEQLVSLDARGISLNDAVKSLASAVQLGVSTIGSVVYVGPPATAARVEALSELRRRDAATSRKEWLATASASWDELAEPRQLAESISKAAGAKVSNPETIPHDVWAAWSGPSLSHTDRLTLVLAGFDLTFELSDDGTEVKIVPAPDELSFERTYEVVGTPAEVGRDLKRILPDIQLQASGAKRLRVTATAEQHAQVADLLAGKRTTTKTVVVPGKKVYTFKAENQLIGAMVQTLAKERDLKVVAAESLVDKLKQRGTVEVEKATFEQALAKVLDPVGIKYKLTETTLELSE